MNTDRALKRLQSKTKINREDDNDEGKIQSETPKNDTVMKRLDRHTAIRPAPSQGGTVTQSAVKENDGLAEVAGNNGVSGNTSERHDYIPTPIRQMPVKSADSYYSELKNGAYYKNAEKQSRLVGEDVLGKYAAMTGGLPSTAAVYAATDAGRQYIGDVENELYKLAQSMYSSDKRSALDAAKDEQNRYRDMIDKLIDSGYTVYDIPSSWVRAAGYDSTYMNRATVGNVADKINSTAGMKYPTRQMFSAALAAYNDGGTDALMDYLATVKNYSSAPLIAYAQEFGKN